VITVTVAPSRAIDDDQAAARGAHGFALATCLLLLTVFAVLAIAGFTAALVEQRIAANVELRERSFHAAEYGIEQALQTPDLATAATLAAPRTVPATGGALPVPGATADTYAYRLYYAGSTASGLPTTDPAALLEAFHFVIEATGFSVRGASSTLVQTFKVLRPAGWTGGPATCSPEDGSCAALPYPPPSRTSWREAEAE
jgi:PilX N-terminal